MKSATSNVCKSRGSGEGVNSLVGDRFRNEPAARVDSCRYTSSLVLLSETDDKALAQCLARAESWPI